MEFYNQISIIKRGRSFIWKFELEFFILRGFEDRSDLEVLKPRDDAIGSSEVMYSKWVWFIEDFWGVFLCATFG